MNLLNKLTIKNLKLNKRRSIVTIIGIILSVALITALSSLYSSFVFSLIKFETSLKGNYHYEFIDVDKSKVKTIENNSKVRELSLVHNLGYARLNDSKNEYKPYLYVKEYDKNALKNILGKLIEGRLPQNSNEIIISNHIKTNGQVDIKVGDSITLDIGKRLSNGEELNQNNPFHHENNEQIDVLVTKEYKVVGIIERPNDSIEAFEAPGYTVISYLNNLLNADKLDVFALYTKKGLRNDLKVTANILGMDEKLFTKYKENKSSLSNKELEEINKAKSMINSNGYLIQLETNPLSISTIQGIGQMVCVVLIIIIVTSVFCIKNSFDISITEKTKQYGMLKSIGATKKQIRKNVLFEAGILGIIGIPIGVLCGLFASFILVQLSNSLALNYSDGVRLFYSISMIAILLSIILGIVTIYFSAIRSSNKASKVSPIKLIRNSAEIKMNSKKLKTPKFIKKLFGIGGVIALKNTKRNKKRYRTTIISLVISIATFIVLFSFSMMIKSGTEDQIRNTKANFEYTIKDYYNNYNLIDQTTKLDNIKNYSISRLTNYTLKNPKYNDVYLRVNSGLTDEEINRDVYINIVALNDSSYRNYLKELGLKYNDTVNKAIMIHTYLFVNANKDGIDEYARYDYNRGDKVNGVVSSYENEQIVNYPFSLEIAKVTDNFPIGVDRYATYLVISDKLLDKNNIKIDTARVSFDSKNASSLEKEIKNILGDEIMSYENFDERKKQEDNILLLVNIFLYGFIIVISLIGITNIFNTITTSMELRKQEFAMLKSIGMTKREFSKMINLESIFIGGKALIYGIVIGLGLSFVIYNFGDTSEGFSVTILPIIISIIVVFVLITSLMKYAINVINKQNTIETIRNENI